MTVKQMNRDDLLNRYASHTFTETTVGSSTIVEFKDGSSNIVGSAQKLDVNDAYRSIRNDLVLGHSVLVTVTEAQRDLFTGIVTGEQIYNTDGTGEIYDGTNWIPM